MDFRMNIGPRPKKYLNTAGARLEREATIRRKLQAKQRAKPIVHAIRRAGPRGPQR